MANSQQVGTVALPPYTSPNTGVVGVLIKTVRAPGTMPALVAGLGTAVVLDPRSTDSLGRVTCQMPTVVGLLWTVTFANPFTSVPMVRLIPEGTTLLQVQPVALTVNGFGARLLVAVAGSPTLTIGYEVVEFP